jgi:hypothetical protein
LGGSCFEASPGKKLAKPISKNNPDVVVHTCHFSYVGGIGMRISAEGDPEQKCKTLSEKITKAKKKAWLK